MKKPRLIATALTIVLAAGNVCFSSIPAPAAALRPSTWLLHENRAGFGRMRLLETLTLPDGKKAEIYSNGLAAIHTKDASAVEYRHVATTRAYGAFSMVAHLPEKTDLIEQLEKAPPEPYIPARVLVVYRSGVTATSDLVVSGTTPVRYTTDYQTNKLLTQLGVVRSERLLRNLSRSALSQMYQGAMAARGVDRARLVDISNAYRLDVTGAPVARAVAELAEDPNVAYVSPDFRVSTMNVRGPTIPQSRMLAMRQRAQRLSIEASSSRLHSDGVPQNYAVSSSFQSLLNAPSLNVMAAYDEIAKAFPGRLPGQGVTITNVSLGDVDDVSSEASRYNACYNDVRIYGPTTILRGGQHYIDWPSMPLIPAYVADTSGDTSGSAQVCGVDAGLTEVGLDFSVMSPLPNGRQRPAQRGSGGTDLLGIAPGANYRLVVPASSTPALSDIVGALVGAARQNPRPDVITASLGITTDNGFPSRYLEEDPLSYTVVASLTNAYGIAVCIAAGDGTELATPAAIGPSGGSAATDLVTAGAQPTSLYDVLSSTAPSAVYDSGSMDVGGTTLDDIFAAPPQNPANAALADQHAFAETRWTGFTSFSSGFGTRVNLSAPSDNVVAFQRQASQDPSAVVVEPAGGTSASAPEAAAAAAVVIQVARLTGHPFTDPIAVRDFLVKTATAVPNVPQADRVLSVGPQINLGHAVEKLLSKAAMSVKPSVERVAIEQRRQLDGLDTTLETDTDPGDIDLRGPVDEYGNQTGLNQMAWLTIAPDWEAMPSGITYSLSVVGSPRTLSSKPWARLLPAQILKAAGKKLASSQNRTVNLEYTARLGRRIVASAYFTLTFGPAAGTMLGGPAPIVAPVVTGNTIAVTYDLSNVRDLSNPQLVVSKPGRTNPESGPIFNPAVMMPLAQTKGTIDVPVSQLEGGGIYGVGIVTGTLPDGSYRVTDFAFTHVSSGNARPAAPLLSQGRSALTHDLEIPLGSKFKLAWDVTNVKKATGAMLEISAPGPGLWGNANPFNNPGGTIRDDNGVDTGSIYYKPLPSTSGTIALDSAKIGLAASLGSVVRVIPMAGSTPAGEASYVSTILMDGIVPANGGLVYYGFGINQNGTDGFLCSDIETASETKYDGIETFDQPTGKMTSIVVSESSPFADLYWTKSAGGLFASDIALIGDQPSSQTLPNYNSYTPIAPSATGTPAFGRAWTPPLPPDGVNPIPLNSAPNQTDSLTAFQMVDGNGFSITQDRILTYNFSTKVFSSYYDMSAPIAAALPNGGYDYALGEDVSTHTSVAGFGDGTHPPLYVTVDLNSGTVGSFSGVGTGFPLSLAIDSTTHMMFSPTYDENIGFYNLSNQTSSIVPMPGADEGGSYGEMSAVDPAHGLVFVEQTVPADLEINNNAMSAIYIYNEQGTLLKSLEEFDLDDVFLQERDKYVQVNPSTRTGFTLGDGAASIQTFSY